MQSDISVGTNTITGTLNYISDYTDFSEETDEQVGNYLALHVEAETADSITVELVGDTSERGEVTLDSDGLIVLRVTNTSQKIRVRAYVDDVVADVKTYSLDSLVLSEE